jgi:hypothetical protein
MSTKSKVKEGPSTECAAQTLGPAQASTSGEVGPSNSGFGGAGNAFRGAQFVAPGTPITRYADATVGVGSPWAKGAGWGYELDEPTLTAPEPKPAERVSNQKRPKTGEPGVKSMVRDVNLIDIVEGGRAQSGSKAKGEKSAPEPESPKTPPQLSHGQRALLNNISDKEARAVAEAQMHKANAVDAETTKRVYNPAPSGDSKEKRSLLDKAIRGGEFKSEPPPLTTEVPVGAGGVGIFRAQASARGSAGLRPSGSKNLGVGDDNTTATASLSAFIGGKISVKGSAELGMGAGAVGIASVGLSGRMTLEASGSVGGELSLAGAIGRHLSDSELKLTGTAALKAELKAIGSIVAWMSLPCIGDRVEHEIPFKEWPIAKWTPALAEVSFSTQSGFSAKCIADPKNLELNIPDYIRGLGEDLYSLVSGFSEDNRAADVVNELHANGTLALLDTDHRAKLISLIMDPVVMEGHELAILRVLRTASDRAQRERILISAYETEEELAPGTGTLAQALEWARGAVDNHTGGRDHQHLTELNLMFQRQ